MKNHAGMCICECSWLPNEEALVEVVSGLRGPPSPLSSRMSCGRQRPPYVGGKDVMDA